MKRILKDTSVETTSNATSSDKQNSFRSGASLPETYIALADKYGQIVGTDNSSKVIVSIDVT